MTLRHLVIALLLLFAATSCRSGRSEAEVAPKVNVDPAAAIEAFDASPQAGFRPRSLLNSAMLADPASSRESALAMLGVEDPEVRLAVVYALSLTGEPADADAMAPLLESPDPRERVLAATGMLSLGDGRAVPVLIEALRIEDPLPFGDPPLRVWQQGRFALLRFTGQDFGLGKAAFAEDAEATVQAWESWWSDAEASFEVVRAPELFQ